MCASVRERECFITIKVKSHSMKNINGLTYIIIFLNFPYYFIAMQDYVKLYAKQIKRNITMEYNHLLHVKVITFVIIVLQIFTSIF